ncbi:MAG: Rad9-domain-containing protein [Piptocephalis tieghemiana]|nr:MAG: Rad9-domain-containing protein [Piptocephalis tieghemiana]
MHASFGPSQLKVFVKALSGMGKFGEDVIFEVLNDRLTWSTCNSSKSALVHLTFPGSFFFSYQVDSSTSKPLSYRFPIKSLLNVFKAKGSIITNAASAATAMRDQEVERVEWRIREEEEEERDQVVGEGHSSRLIILLVYTHGVSKVRELYFSEGDPVHGVFDPSLVNLRIRSIPRVWNDALGHLHPRLDELTLRAHPDSLYLSSSPSLLNHGQDTSMLQTHLQLPVVDLQDLVVRVPEVALTLAVRDFRSVLSLADTLEAEVTLACQGPGSPMHLALMPTHPTGHPNSLPHASVLLSTTYPPIPPRGVGEMKDIGMDGTLSGDGGLEWVVPPPPPPPPPHHRRRLYVREGSTTTTTTTTTEEEGERDGLDRPSDSAGEEEEEEDQLLTTWGDHPIPRLPSLSMYPTEEGLHGTLEQGEEGEGEEEEELSHPNSTLLTGTDTDLSSYARDRRVGSEVTWGEERGVVWGPRVVPSSSSASSFSTKPSPAPPSSSLMSSSSSLERLESGSSPEIGGSFHGASSSSSSSSSREPLPPGPEDAGSRVAHEPSDLDSREIPISREGEEDDHLYPRKGSRKRQRTSSPSSSTSWDPSPSL